jgi:hypothetical protein
MSSNTFIVFPKLLIAHISTVPRIWADVCTTDRDLSDVRSWVQRGKNETF